MKFHNLIEPKHLTVKIRYKDEGHNAICRELQNGNIEVIFDNPRKSVTKGQSIVIYDGCDVVGGGVIKEPIVL
jgi:tRNA-specific 2-thiouridylase